MANERYSKILGATGQYLKRVTNTDRDLLNFRMRRYDFSDFDATEEKSIAPYDHVRPGMWFGFDPSGSVRVRKGQGLNAETCAIFSTAANASSWMSMEFVLNPRALAETGMVICSMTAAASPSAELQLVLRLPDGDAPSGYHDCRPQHMKLGARIRRTSLSIIPPLEHLRPHKGNRNPVLIAFLPRRKTQIFLSEVRVAPSL